MLTVNLLCVGKIKEPYFRDAVAEYAKRLRPYSKFTITEIPESRLGDAPGATEIADALGKEGKLLLRKAVGLVLPLCIEGKQLTSEALAAQLDKAKQTHGAVSFVIGSSHGLSNEVKNAGPGISLSKMTFPHTLARVLLTEQIYRAFMIMHHTKYHK